MTYKFLITFKFLFEITPKPQNPVESLMREVIEMNSKVILDNYKDIIKLYTQYGDDFLIHC